MTKKRKSQPSTALPYEFPSSSPSKSSHNAPPSTPSTPLPTPSITPHSATQSASSLLLSILNTHLSNTTTSLYPPHMIDIILRQHQPIASLSKSIAIAFTTTSASVPSVGYSDVDAALVADASSSTIHHPSSTIHHPSSTSSMTGDITHDNLPHLSSTHPLSLWMSRIHAILNGTYVIPSLPFPSLFALRLLTLSYCQLSPCVAGCWITLSITLALRQAVDGCFMKSLSSSTSSTSSSTSSTRAVDDDEVLVAALSLLNTILRCISSTSSSSLRSYLVSSLIPRILTLAVPLAALAITTNAASDNDKDKEKEGLKNNGFSTFTMKSPLKYGYTAPSSGRLNDGLQWIPSSLREASLTLLRTLLSTFPQACRHPTMLASIERAALASLSYPYLSQSSSSSTLQSTTTQSLTTLCVEILVLSATLHPLSAIAKTSGDQTGVFDGAVSWEWSIQRTLGTIQRLVTHVLHVDMNDDTGVTAGVTGSSSTLPSTYPIASVSSILSSLSINEGPDQWIDLKSKNAPSKNNTPSKNSTPMHPNRTEGEDDVKGAALPDAVSSLILPVFTQHLLTLTTLLSALLVTTPLPPSKSTTTPITTLSSSSIPPLHIPLPSILKTLQSIHQVIAEVLQVHRGWRSSRASDIGRYGMLRYSEVLNLIPTFIECYCMGLTACVKALRCRLLPHLPPIATSVLSILSMIWGEGAVVRGMPGDYHQSRSHIYQLCSVIMTVIGPSSSKYLAAPLQRYLVGEWAWRVGNIKSSSLSLDGATTIIHRDIPQVVIRGSLSDNVTAVGAASLRQHGHGAIDGDKLSSIIYHPSSTGTPTSKSSKRKRATSKLVATLQSYTSGHGPSALSHQKYGTTSFASIISQTIAIGHQSSFSTVEFIAASTMLTAWYSGAAAASLTMNEQVEIDRLLISLLTTTSSIGMGCGIGEGDGNGGIALHGSCRALWIDCLVASLVSSTTSNAWTISLSSALPLLQSLIGDSSESVITSAVRGLSILDLMIHPRGPLLSTSSLSTLSHGVVTNVWENVYAVYVGGLAPSQDGMHADEEVAEHESVDDDGDDDDGIHHPHPSSFNVRMDTPNAVVTTDGFQSTTGIQSDQPSLYDSPSTVLATESKLSKIQQISHPSPTIVPKQAIVAPPCVIDDDDDLDFAIVDEGPDDE